MSLKDDGREKWRTTKKAHSYILEQLHVHNMRSTEMEMNELKFICYSIAWTGKQIDEKMAHSTNSRLLLSVQSFAFLVG